MMRESFLSFAEAKFTMGDFNDMVLQRVAKSQIKVRARQDNVAGVKLPVFEHYIDGSSSYELTGALISY